MADLSKLTITESTECTTEITSASANGTPAESPTTDIPEHKSVTPSTRSIPLSAGDNAVIVLFSRRSDITFREFKNRFENNWMPTLERVCGPLFPVTYVRRYIADKENDAMRQNDGPLGLPSIMIGKEEDLLFDCLVEATFEDNLHMMQFFSFINEEEPAAALLECESTFSDIQKLRVIIMENRVTINKTRKLKTWE